MNVRDLAFVDFCRAANRAPRWVVMGVVAAACWMLVPSAYGSIVVPNLLTFELVDGGASLSDNGSGSAPRDDDRVERDTNETVSLVADALPAGGSSSGSSSSGGSFGGSSPTAIDRVMAVELANPGLAGWISGQTFVYLPMPPCNDLLRPPQSS